MNTKNNDRWQHAYEPAPDAFRRSIASALEQTREVPMKRFTMRTAMIAVALLVMLAGAALAVAGGDGVLRFLFPGTTPAADTLPVQTLPAQTGGDQMENITVTVRDAVSDGVAIHLAVECAVKNPGDALLYDFDADYLYPLPEHGVPGRTLPVEAEGQGLRKPFISKAREADRVLIVGTPMAMLGDVDTVASSQSWFYESPGVLVVDYIIDLRPGAFEGVENPPPFPLLGPLTVTLTPSVWLQTPGESTVDMLEKGSVEVTVTQTQAEQARYTATNLPVEGEGYRLDAVDFLSTPQGLYGTFRFADTTGIPPWENESPALDNLWADVLGADGEPLPALGSYRKYEDPEGEGTVQRIEVFFAARESLPETVILRPYDAGTGEVYPDITLNLQK